MKKPLSMHPLAVRAREYRASERGKAVIQRYRASKKGKAAISRISRRYSKSEKGRATQKRYQATSKYYEARKRWFRGPKGQAWWDQKMASMGLQSFDRVVRCCSCQCIFTLSALDYGHVSLDYRHLNFVGEPKMSFVCEQCLEGDQPLLTKELTDDMLLAVEEEGAEAAAIRFAVEQGCSLACRIVPEHPVQHDCQSTRDWFNQQRRGLYPSAKPKKQDAEMTDEEYYSSLRLEPTHREFLDEIKKKAKRPPPKWNGWDI